VESIIDEVRSIPPHNGVRRVFFTDDNLFADAARARALCGAIIRAKLDLRWRGMLRISLMTNDMASLMAESGCLEALLGVESGDGDMLKRMNKPMTPDKILAGVTSLSQCGIHTKSTFIVGFPGETEASIERTVALLNAYPTNLPAAHRYLFFTYAVLPLSEVARPESRHSHQLQGYGYHWKHATMDSATAARLMAAAQDRIKPELSPNYVLEVPEAEGLNSEAIKEVYLLRNEIVRIRSGLTPGDEAALWRKLESCFAR
jgi:p-methyltransferase